MNEPSDIAVDEPAEKPAGLPLRDEEGHIEPTWIEQLRGLIAAGDAQDIAEAMAPLHAADTGDVLEALDPEARLALVRLLGDRFDFEALTEVDESVRSDLIGELPNAEIARGVATLDSDDAVAILEDIEQEDRDDPFHTYVVDLEVEDLAHLTRIVSALRASDALAEAQRV